jgi:orotate phosphoribosyltransferase-like protein
MNDSALENKLDAITELLQNLLALELSKNGLTHEQIRKHLHVRKQTINKMLKGVKKERA